jgi:hypothetical protein
MTDSIDVTNRIHTFVVIFSKARRYSVAAQTFCFLSNSLQAVIEKERVYKNLGVRHREFPVSVNSKGD